MVMTELVVLFLDKLALCQHFIPFVCRFVLVVESSHNFVLSDSSRFRGFVCGFSGSCCLELYGITPNCDGAFAESLAGKLWIVEV